MIDWSRINELREEVGEEDFDEVIELFLDEVNGSLDRLETMSNGPELQAEFHYLKGCALNLGFAEFAALCQRGETLAETDTNKVPSSQETKLSFQRSLAVFEKRDHTNVA